MANSWAKNHNRHLRPHAVSFTPVAEPITSVAINATSTTVTPATDVHSESSTSNMASALEALQSKEHRTLLDEIDNLRLQGVSDLVPLPQIVVCGDQSSGKSSVLEAVSGVPFPRSDVLCTRFATEVILRPADELTITVSIIPALNASKADRKKLEKFKENIQGLEAFPTLVEKAKEYMGINNGTAFSRHVLRVNVAGPGKPKLTIVDLPGLIHTANREQSETDKDLITDMVEEYVMNPRTIVLAVVSAKNDIANQIILSTTRKYDPDGQRTLGLITKPDLLNSGSQSEAQFIELANNANINLRLGWHVVKNRDYTDRDSSLEVRDQAEHTFFSKGKWQHLPRNLVGVKTLRDRLSRVLLIQVKKHLPALIEDVRSKLAECETELSKLGASRSNSEEQRSYLLAACQSFQNICKAALDGTYDGAFFGELSSHDHLSLSKRLRSMVQNLNQSFAYEMRHYGHYRVITDGEDSMFSGQKPTNGVFSFGTNTQGVAPALTKSGATSEDKSIKGSSRQVFMTSKEHTDWLKSLLKESRGCELPGQFNPLLIKHLFHDQSKLWPQKAERHVNDIIKVVKFFIDHLVQHAMDKQTASNLKAYWLNAKLNDLTTAAKQALERLCNDRARHPITYNHYCTDNLQKQRKDRQAKDLRKVIGQHFGIADSHYALPVMNKTLSVDALVSTIQRITVADPDDFACRELMDNMSAFYKVAIKTFVDNVTVQVIENNLVGDLDKLLTSMDIAMMPTELITDIAGESFESQALRQQLKRRTDILKKGMAICQRQAPTA